MIAPLSELLGTPVRFSSECVGKVSDKAVSELNDGDVLLLENTRFHTGEEANDPEFAGQLAALGDLYVNDAFFSRASGPRLYRGCRAPASGFCRARPPA